MQTVKSTAKEVAPWKEGLPWWFVLVEGALIALVGLYIVLNTDVATNTIVALLTIILVAVSVFDIFSGWARVQNADRMIPISAMDTMRLVRGGAAAALGLAAFFGERRESITTSDARLFLGWGLIIFGALGVVAFVISLIEGRGWEGSILFNLAFLLVGIDIVFFHIQDDEYSTSHSVKWLGWALLVAGALIAAYSIWEKYNADKAVEAAAAAPVLPAAVVDAGAIDSAAAPTVGAPVASIDDIKAGTGAAGAKTVDDTIDPAR